MKTQSETNAIFAEIIKNANARTAKKGPTKRATKEELHDAMMKAIWGENINES